MNIIDIMPRIVQSRHHHSDELDPDGGVETEFLYSWGNKHGLKISPEETKERVRMLEDALKKIYEDIKGKDNS